MLNLIYPWYVFLIMVTVGAYRPCWELLATFFPTVVSLPPYRQLYLAKNTLKAFNLMMICPLALYQTMEILYFGRWNTTALQWMGVTYAAADTAALLYIHNLPATTLAHHACTTLFCVANMLCDYGQPTIMRAIVFYAMCSCFSYSVNWYLGARHLLQPESGVLMRNWAFWCYLGSLMVNWPIQTVFVYRYLFVHSHWLSTLIYCLGLGFIVQDDIVLLTFLAHK